MDAKKKGNGGDTAAAENGISSVSSIIKQLESGKQPFRAKPPVPPNKPSSSSMNGIAHSQAAHDHPNSGENDEVNANHSRRVLPNSKDDNANTEAAPSPFRYVSADILITKVGGTLKDDDGMVKKKLLSPPPAPPPKPNFSKTGTEDKTTTTERKEITKTTTGNKTAWIKINERWIPSTENSERSSTTSMSSSENEDRSELSHMETENEPKEEVQSFKKPAIPQRHSSRTSTDNNCSPLRPLPPVPPSKPSIMRKWDSNTNSMLSNSSVPSMSDDGDSDVESASLANSSGRTENDGEAAEENSEANEGVAIVVHTPTLTKAQKAFRCAEEFLVTEKSYVKTLEDLSENFLQYMEQQTKAANRPIVEPDIPRILAQRLHEIRNLHRLLAEDFQTRLDNWDNDPRLADILLEKGPFLKMSIRFLQGKEDLAKEVLNASKKFPEFHAALTAFEKQHFEGLHLVHKLDSVHQRLCRYPLLLSSYLKYLTPGTPEYESAEKAKEFMNGITLDLQGSLAQEDGTRKLSELYRRIVQSSGFEVIEPGRKLLKEGPILKYSRKERQPRHLILFNDVLICCAPSVPSMLKVRHIFRLKDPATNITVKGDSGDPDFPGWEFVVKGRHKSIIFVTECEMEGKAWVKEIQNAIGGAQRKMSEAHQPRLSIVSGESSNLEETLSTVTTEPEEPCPSNGHASTSTLGRVAPAWVPDQRVTMCQCCGLAFTKIRRRRHHCRACGRVICEECSGRAPLEFLNYAADRVCRTCYAVLIEQLKDAKFLEDVVDRTRMTGSQFMSLFSAPKNSFRVDVGSGMETRSGIAVDTYDEDGEPVLIKGYLRFSRNRQNWKQYWTVVREDGVMEFYKAMNDKISEMKIVLLGWQVRPIDREECVFQLSHTNQFETGSNRQMNAGSNGDASMHYWLKSDSVDAMDRWLSALDDFFQKFAV